MLKRIPSYQIISLTHLTFSVNFFHSESGIKSFDLLFSIVLIWSKCDLSMKFDSSTS